MVLFLSTLGCTRSADTTAGGPESKSREDEQSQTGPSKEISKPLENEGARSELWAAIPRGLQFNGLSAVEVSRSWEDRISKYLGNEKSYLVAANSRFHGALGFQSEEEQAKLIEQGFPMPEEWQAAKNMSDSELERLANGGDIKAQMFLIDRVSQQVAPILATRGFDQTPADRELYRQYVQANTAAGILVHSTRSPFAAYLQGILLSAGTLGNQVEPIAGSFRVARELGDARADRFQSLFFRQHPNLDAGAVLASYSAIKPGND